MLIVEGADCVGKTTLCKQLEKMLGTHTYQHLSRLPDGHDRMWAYVEMMSRRTIRDRFHVSELVYPFVRREGDTPLTPDKLRIVEAYLALHGAFVVVITASESLLEDRWRGSGRAEMYALDEVVRANEMFHELSIEGRERVRIDAHLHVTLDEQDISDKVAAVHNEYVRRQDQLTYQLRLRENWTALK